MRPRIVIPVLACAAVVLVALVWVRLGASGGPAADPSSALLPAPVSPAPVPLPTPEEGAPRAQAAAEPVAAPGTPAETGRAWVTQSKLMELSSHDDPESLRTILGGLTSPEPGIRKAALAATRQFGSRDAIPYLQEAAEHTDEPREKVAILDAIEYLKMPSLTELRETARKSGG